MNLKNVEFSNSENLTIRATTDAGVACPTDSRCVHFDFKNIQVSEVNGFHLDVQTRRYIDTSSVNSVDSEGYSVRRAH